MKKLFLAMFVIVSTVSPAFANPLEQLNGTFTRSCADGKAISILAGGPIWIVSDDEVTLVKDGIEVETIRLDMKLFHDLKSISHGVLSTIFLLDRALTSFDSTLKQELEHLLVSLRGAYTGIIQLPEGARARNMEILRKSERLVSKALQNGLSRQDLETYVSTQLTHMSQNLADAAAHQEATLTVALEKLEADLGSAAEKLRVVILGPLQPRVKNFFVTYFQNHFGLKNEDRARILYAENIFERSRALDLLGAVLLDRKISEYTGWNLEQDLRAPTIESILKKKQGSKQGGCPFDSKL